MTYNPNFLTAHPQPTPTRKGTVRVPYHHAGKTVSPAAKMGQKLKATDSTDIHG